MSIKEKKSRLWTFDFTVITVGSLISMAGNAIAGIALGFITAKTTNNNIALFALLQVGFALPAAITPMLAGPILDRIPRKHIIYSLDFLSTLLYIGLYFLVKHNALPYGLQICGTMIFGCIQGIYTVAYDSLYPNLVAPGNMRRAYAIGSMLWPLAGGITYLLSAAGIEGIGVAKLFLVVAGAFFTAAVFETMVRKQEEHIKPTKAVKRPPLNVLWRDIADKTREIMRTHDKSGIAAFFAAAGEILARERRERIAAYEGSDIKRLSQFIDDLKEGFAYLRGEKGLAGIVVYFFCNAIVWGAAGVMLYPYFLSAFGESTGLWMFTMLMTASTIGRFLGGFAQYFIKYPASKKFAIALFVYSALCFIEGGYLFVPVFGIMLVLHFISGALAVTSYNIRISATQQYVPDLVRARFNSVFVILNTLGTALGAGVAATMGTAWKIPVPIAVAILNFINVLMIIFVLLPRRKDVAAIYNVDL